MNISRFAIFLVTRIYLFANDVEASRALPYHTLKVGDYNIGCNGPLLTLPFHLAFLLN